MAKIKLTKTALKEQRDELAQFQRFLPTLQLKKQQLQMEMRSCLERVSANEQQEKSMRESLSSWTRLFGDTASVERLAVTLHVSEIHTDVRNIAGVNVPVFDHVDFQQDERDLFTSDPWEDDALELLKKIVSIREERNIIRKQYELIGAELRVTTQRVNLFEKVRIPECKSNIRKIQISISDMSTAAVARSKIAKRKLQEEAVS